MESDLKILDPELQEALQTHLLELAEDHQNQSQQNQITLSELYYLMRKLGRPYVGYNQIISALRGLEAEKALRLFLFPRRRHIGVIVLKQNCGKKLSG